MCEAAESSIRADEGKLAVLQEVQKDVEAYGLKINPNDPCMAHMTMGEGKQLTARQ